MATANVIKVDASNQSELLQFLYDNSAMTFEGLALESFDEWIAHVEGELGLTKPDLYHVPGAVMNSFYGLTGDNAYPDDLAIASIPLCNVKSSPVMYRLQYGCRWFDDIVDNNRRREEYAA